MWRGFCRCLGKIVLTFDTKCKSLTQMCNFYNHKTQDNNQTDEKEIHDNFITKDTKKILLYVQQHGMASMVYIPFAEENGDFFG